MSFDDLRLLKPLFGEQVKKNCFVFFLFISEEQKLRSIESEIIEVKSVSS